MWNVKGNKIQQEEKLYQKPICKVDGVKMEKNRKE